MIQQCYLEIEICSYAGAVFASSVLKGLNGEPNVVECSYVQSNVTELPFFASKVKVLYLWAVR